MKDVKTKPKMGKPKMLNRAAAVPKEARAILQRHYKEQQAQKRAINEPQTAANYATDRIEGITKASAAYLFGSGKRLAIKHLQNKRLEKKKTAQVMPDGDTAQNTKQQAYQPKTPEYVAQQQKAADQMPQAYNSRNTSSKNAAGISFSSDTPRQQARQEYLKGQLPTKRHLQVYESQQTDDIIKRSELVGKQRDLKMKKDKDKMKSGNKPAVRTNMLKAAPAKYSTKIASTTKGLTQQTKKKAQQKRRDHAMKRIANQTKKTAKTAAKAVVRLGKALAKLAAAAINTIIAAGGGIVLIVAMLLIVAVAAFAASPFGIIFANEKTANDAVLLPVAVAQINIEFSTYLDEIQSGSHDRIELHGNSADWIEVIAVFAARTAGTEDGNAIDVTAMDEQRIELLRQVFWDMNTVTTQVETIHHLANDEEEAWTETILHVYLLGKSYTEMPAIYNFSQRQIEALEQIVGELRPVLTSVAGSLMISDAELKAIIANLPENLSPERKAAVEVALSLVGKVNYFWGGKSSAIGWDSRWGTSTTVTAAGSPTTGTVRPFGLDCSGFVTWIVINIYDTADAASKIGHGGDNQWDNCTSISWADAMPGDLVFYPSNSHVGIVVGKDNSGGLLVCHTASGANNTVVTGIDGFTKIGRPNFYNN